MLHFGIKINSNIFFDAALWFVGQAFYAIATAERGGKMRSKKKSGKRVKHALHPSSIFCLGDYYDYIGII